MMVIRISIKKSAWPLLEILLALVSYALIHINAMGIIAPIYGFFIPRELAPWEHLVAILCMLIPFLFLRCEATTPAACASWTLYALLYLSAAVIGVTVLPDITDYLTLMAFLIVCLFVFYLVAAGMPIFKLAKLPFAVHLDVVIFIVLAMSCLFVWYKAGFHIHLGVDDVYTRRLDARETIGLGAYAVAPLRLLLPVLAIYIWHKTHNIIWLLLLGLSCLGIYSFDGTKSIFLFPLVLLVLFIGIITGRIARIVLFLIVGLNLLALLEYSITEHCLLADYIIRRAFVVPGMLTSMYWEYAPQVESLQQITYEIGLVYFNNPDTNANSNFWMWGWCWLGVTGGLLISITSGLLISLFSFYPGARFPQLGSLMACGCALIWTEQFLHTSLLSSSIIYLVSIAFLMRLTPNSFKSWMSHELHIKKTAS